jgi:Outer membrane lipoprotein-sorting protein
MKVFPATAVLILFLATGVMAKTTNDFVEAIIQGRNLAQQLSEQRPAGNFTNAGILKIRDRNGNTSEVPIKCEIIITSTNWQSVYQAYFTNTTETLTVTHTHLASMDDGFDQLEWRHDFPTLVGAGTALRGMRMFSFANSDFAEGDLSLEFFRWPQQKILPKPTNLVRGREYTLLESTNPSTNGYSRVLSWIDKETGGILQAEAYDANGKLLKVFEPKSFKKVNGQWELQEMEIRNVQTGSRTRLEFDLNKQ